MGSEGISVAHALEPVSVRLRALLHLLAGFQQLVDAGEEFGEVFGAGEVWDRAFVRDAQADACDLAAAHGDPEPERVLGVEDDEFDLETDGGVGQELLQPVVVVRDVHELDDALAYGLGALANGIAGEEGAQDDPEPIHASDCKRAGASADSESPHPTNRGGIALKTRAKFSGFPTEVKRLFPANPLCRGGAGGVVLTGDRASP